MVENGWFGCFVVDVVMLIILDGDKVGVVSVILDVVEVVDLLFVYFMGWLNKFVVYMLFFEGEVVNVWKWLCIVLVVEVVGLL